MLALTLIRSNPDLVRDSLTRRHEDPELVDQIIDADVRRRALVDERDTLRAEQNKASKEIGKAGKPSEQALAQLRDMRDRIRRSMVDNLSIGRDDFEDVPILARAGGWGRANQDFGGELPEVLRALNEAVAA